MGYMNDLKVLQRITSLKGKTIKLVLSDAQRWYIVTTENEILVMEIGFSDEFDDDDDYKLIFLSKHRVINVLDKKHSMDHIKESLAEHGVLDYDAMRKAEQERLEREKVERAERAEKQEYETYLRLKAKYEGADNDGA